MTVEEYIALVDATGRAVRAGKRGTIPPAMAAILARLNLDADTWLTSMMLGRQMGGSGVGSVTARAVEAKRRGVGWVANKCLLFVAKRAA
jgi:hypothetical protein